MNKRVLKSEGQLFLTGIGELQGKQTAFSEVSLENLGPSDVVITRIGFASYEAEYEKLQYTYGLITQGEPSVVLNVDLYKGWHDAFEAQSLDDERDEFWRKVHTAATKVLVVETLTIHGTQTLRWEFRGKLQDSPVAQLFDVL